MNTDDTGSLKTAAHTTHGQDDPARGRDHDHDDTAGAGDDREQEGQGKPAGRDDAPGHDNAVFRVKQHVAGLTKFRVRILAVLAEDARYGLAVKRALEDYYGEDVRHGRLYPNLDTLAENGLVEKRAVNGRRNRYEITEQGLDALAYEVAWLQDRLETAREEADDAE